MDLKKLDTFLRQQQDREQTEIPVPTAPTLPAAPDPELAQYSAYDNSAATTSPVSTIPSVPTTPAAPGPENDQDADPQATPDPTVPTVPKRCNVPGPAEKRDGPQMSKAPFATQKPSTVTCDQEQSRLSARLTLSDRLR